jgi:RNA polymerase sigma-70 factor (ECF subfamily)
MASENEFIILIKGGDKKAFETLFKDFYSNLCAYANTFVYDIDEAEDIVQEFMFNIWQKKEELPIDLNIRAYFFKSIRNRCLNYLKHNKIENKYKELKFEDYTENFYAENKTEVNELQDKIRKSINKLPPERKKVFIMHRYEDLKYKEIAEKLNISIKTVENQIGKALVFLREELKEYLPILFFIFIKFLKIF